MWIDRFLYKLHHPELTNSGKLYVGFCPEGHFKPGDTVQEGEWTKEIVVVEPRYKEANEFIERKFSAKEE